MNSAISVINTNIGCTGPPPPPKEESIKVAIAIMKTIVKVFKNLFLVIFNSKTSF
ncbi:MAG: hypothetical protein LBM96_00870 [Methanobrevibacter sp.]|nr:hypothetical protein [Candidatus Methanoflexus mossambicus]